MGRRRSSGGRDAVLFFVVFLGFPMALAVLVQVLRAHPLVAAYVGSAVVGCGVAAFYVWLVRLVRTHLAFPQSESGASRLERLRSDRITAVHVYRCWLNTGGSAPVVLLALTGPVLELLLLGIGEISLPTSRRGWLEQGVPGIMMGAPFVAGCILVIVARTRTERQLRAAVWAIDEEIEVESASR